MEKIEKKPAKNPWTPQDEREHPSSMMEWWCTMAFFETEDKKKYSFKSTFTEWSEYDDIGSVLHSCLHDLENKTHLESYYRNEKERLISKENEFFIKYDDSYITGSCPNYKMFFHDKKNEMKLDIKYHVKSLPHWVAQDVTNGWLPMGIGCFRYGFMPLCDITGTIEKKSKKYKIKGTGYFEHVWGNFFYQRPLSTIKEAEKTISIYFRLLLWWLKEHKPKAHSSIKVSMDNNPFGYDWSWAVFDNGWALFYGNILGFFMNGPGLGVIILSKDGKTYNELGNFSLKYNSTKKSKNFDFVYPTNFKISAKKGKEILHLNFRMTADPKEYISKFKKSRFWKGLVICEAPGEVEGYYSDGKEKIKLRGFCKIEPQRQVSIFGHNSFEINFKKSKKDLGIEFDFESHFLKKKIFAKIQFLQRPYIKLNFQRITNKK